MATETNPVASILSQISTQIRSEESRYSTTDAALESYYSMAASEASSLMSVLATNPSAGEIYASIASGYSSMLFPVTAEATTTSGSSGPKTGRVSTQSGSSASQPGITSAIGRTTSGTSMSSAISTSISSTTLLSSAPGLSAGSKLALGLGVGIGLPILVLLAVIVYLLHNKNRKAQLKQSSPLSRSQAVESVHHGKAELTSTGTTLNSSQEARRNHKYLVPTSQYVLPNISGMYESDSQPVHMPQKHVVYELEGNYPR